MLEWIDISVETSQAIVGPERKFYPVMENIGSLNPEGTGLFLAGQPVGFTFTHNFRREYLDWAVGGEEEANKPCAELDFIYVRHRYRNQGFGSLLFYIAHQRLVEGEAKLLFTHVTDRSGKMSKLCKDLGYSQMGLSKQYLSAMEYKKSLETEEERQELKTKLSSFGLAAGHGFGP